MFVMQTFYMCSACAVDTEQKRWPDVSTAGLARQEIQMSKRIHVVPHGSGWATRSEGASRVGGTHRTQTEGTDADREQAIRGRV